MVDAFVRLITYDLEVLLALWFTLATVHLICVTIGCITLRQILRTTRLAEDRRQFERHRRYLEEDTP